MERNLLDKIMGIIDEFILKDSLYCIEARWISSEDTLVIYIDSLLEPKASIDLLCCERIHRKIFKDEAINLELSKIIKKDFNLELSSPGINRPLRKIKDFKDFLGSRVEVKTVDKLGRKRFVGTLKSVDEDSLSVEIELEDGKIESFKVSNLQSVEVLSTE